MRSFPVKWGAFFICPPGNKKPYFSLKDIKKYQDKIKKEKSVSLIMLDGKKRTTIFHVNSEGEIYCSFESIEYNIDDLDGLTKYSSSILNKILSLFIKYFDPTSLVYQEFNNITDENTGSCRGCEFGVLLSFAWFRDVIYQRSKRNKVAFKMLSMSEEVWRTSTFSRGHVV